MDLIPLEITSDFQSLPAAFSMAAFRDFSNTFFESQNPCFVLPNELGPADVGVSL